MHHIHTDCDVHCRFKCKKNEENWIFKGSMAKNPLAILLRTREQKKGSNLKKKFKFFYLRNEVLFFYCNHDDGAHIGSLSTLSTHVNSCSNAFAKFSLTIS